MSIIHGDIVHCHRAVVSVNTDGTAAAFGGGIHNGNIFHGDAGSLHIEGTAVTAGVNIGNIHITHDQRSHRRSGNHTAETRHTVIGNVQVLHGKYTEAAGVDHAALCRGAAAAHKGDVFQISLCCGGVVVEINFRIVGTLSADGVVFNDIGVGSVFIDLPLHRQFEIHHIGISAHDVSEAVVDSDRIHGHVVVPDQQRTAAEGFHFVRAVEVEENLRLRFRSAGSAFQRYRVVRNGNIAVRKYIGAAVERKMSQEVGSAFHRIGAIHRKSAAGHIDRGIGGCDIAVEIDRAADDLDRIRRGLGNIGQCRTDIADIQCSFQCSRIACINRRTLIHYIHIFRADFHIHSDIGNIDQSGTAQDQSPGADGSAAMGGVIGECVFRFYMRDQKRTIHCQRTIGENGSAAVSVVDIGQLQRRSGIHGEFAAGVNTAAASIRTAGIGDLHSFTRHDDFSAAARIDGSAVGGDIVTVEGDIVQFHGLEICCVDGTAAGRRRTFRRSEIHIADIDRIEIGVGKIDLTAINRFCCDMCIADGVRIVFRSVQFETGLIAFDFSVETAIYRCRTGGNGGNSVVPVSEFAAAHMEFTVTAPCHNTRTENVCRRIVCDGTDQVVGNGHRAVREIGVRRACINQTAADINTLVGYCRIKADFHIVNINGRFRCTQIGIHSQNTAPQPDLIVCCRFGGNFVIPSGIGHQETGKCIQCHALCIDKTVHICCCCCRI